MPEKKVISIRERILACKDMKSELIEVKAWGNEKILVKSITANERYKLLENCTDNKGNLDQKKHYISLAIACAFDPKTDERIFNYDDYETLSEKSSAAIEAITQVALRLNGIGEEEREKAEKN